MVRLQISAAAFAGICAGLPGNVKRRERESNGDVFMWLDRMTVAKLRHLRGPGEDYSVVILRVAEDVGAER
jgi:hypothetical protein